jgi:UDP-glucose 4-epimerase
VPDILDSGVDAVLHAAWDLTTAPAQRPTDVFKANLLTTTELLEACRDHSVSKFAYVSTCAVYGDAVDTSEDVLCCPVTINGQTKLLNEMIVQDFCAQSGIECQIYRVFNMFGGRDRFSILSHLRRAVDGAVPFTLNNGGTGLRDFTHVDDVARILVSLIQMDMPGVHMNVGTGRATRISDIVDVVRRLHPELQIRHVSTKEVASSRADTSRLSATLPDLNFIDVIDFVERSFGRDEVRRS